jgi:hypothetical protein
MIKFREVAWVAATAAITNNTNPAAFSNAWLGMGCGGVGCGIGKTLSWERQGLPWVFGFTGIGLQRKFPISTDGTTFVHDALLRGINILLLLSRVKGKNCKGRN